MDKSSFQKIIDRAMAEERAAYVLYSKCSERSKNATSKEFFSELAKQEEGHEKRLKHISLKDVGDFDEAKLDKIVASDFFVEVKIKEDMSPQDVLIYAIKSEGKAIAAYTGLAAATDDPEAKKMFNLLAEEEIKHKVKLEDAYEERFYQFF